jgi:glyoxylase-like metal-dependent hydrolase (beta-lactamase superfamily II)
LAEKQLAPEQVRYVIPTHVHLDHAGGAGSMMAAFPNAELLIHPRGARHMIDPERLIASAMEVYGEPKFRHLYGEILPIDPQRVVEMEDGESVNLGGRLLEFRHTRGHANHHFCVWDKTSRGWFSGDMFGISYPWCRFPRGDYVFPATTPTQFDPEDFLDSLQLLASYRPERIYLTHYGELAFTPEKAALLASQVEAYGGFATRHADRRESLEQVLGDYSLSLIGEFEPHRSEAELRQLLAFDMDLNAQGLDVWRQRLEKP